MMLLLLLLFYAKNISALESIDFILVNKEKKSIIVDPDAINDFLKKNLKKELDPNKIIDLFSN